MSRIIDIDGALFERLRPRLKAISCRIVGSEAEAEDIVQDCYLKWWDAEQAALTTPAAWLTTVVRRQSIDRLRQRARDMRAAGTASELRPDVPPAQPQESLLLRAGLEEAMSRLMTCLSPSERLALVLRDVFDCAHVDIATALGTNTANARQYLARARRRLRADGAAAGNGTAAGEKLSRELVLRFQAAISGMDMPALLTLLGAAQPMWVHTSPQPRIEAAPCANDTRYGPALAA